MSLLTEIRSILESHEKVMAEDGKSYHQWRATTVQLWILGIGLILAAAAGIIGAWQYHTKQVDAATTSARDIASKEAVEARQRETTAQVRISQLEGQLPKVACVDELRSLEEKLRKAEVATRACTDEPPTTKQRSTGPGPKPIVKPPQAERDLPEKTLQPRLQALDAENSRLRAELKDAVARAKASSAEAPLPGTTGRVAVGQRVSRTVGINEAARFDDDVIVSATYWHPNTGTDISLNEETIWRQSTGRLKTKEDATRTCYLDFMAVATPSKRGEKPTFTFDYSCHARQK